MSQAEWIGVIAVAVVAILIVVLLLRRKPAGGTAASGDIAVPAPAPLLDPESIAAPPPVEAEPTFPVAVPDPVDLPDGLAEEETPAPVSTPDAPAAAIGEAVGDDLRRLKGVGPKIVTILQQEGVTRYAQIAAWTDADVAAIDTKLGSFAGRPVRDNWVDQARLLAAGDVAGYEAKYGKL